MDGWMDGQMDEWMDGWMDGQNGWIDFKSSFVLSSSIKLCDLGKQSLKQFPLPYRSPVKASPGTIVSKLPRMMPGALIDSLFASVLKSPQDCVQITQKGPNSNII